MYDIYSIQTTCWILMRLHIPVTDPPHCKSKFGPHAQYVDITYTRGQAILLLVLRSYLKSTGQAHQKLLLEHTVTVHNLILPRTASYLLPSERLPFSNFLLLAILSFPYLINFTYCPGRDSLHLSYIPDLTTRPISRSAQILNILLKSARLQKFCSYITSPQNTIVGFEGLLGF